MTTAIEIKSHADYLINVQHHKIDIPGCRGEGTGFSRNVTQLNGEPKRFQRAFGKELAVPCLRDPLKGQCCITIRINLLTCVRWNGRCLWLIVGSFANGCRVATCQTSIPCFLKWVQREAYAAGRLVADYDAEECLNILPPFVHGHVLLQVCCSQSLIL